jgi:hypothetical protein
LGRAFGEATGLRKNGQPGAGAYDGSMVTKKKAALRPGRGDGIAVVNEGGVHGALRRGSTKELSPEEEKVMRMRVGAAPPRAAPLERSFEESRGDGAVLTDLEIEIRAAEIEAWMKWKARLAERSRAPAPVPSRAKERIIRALRKKA